MNRGDIGKGYDLPYQDDRHFLGLIGRVADWDTRQPLTEPFLIGTGGTFYPDVLGAKGCLQTAVNHNGAIGPAKGGFYYNHREVK